jgi:hypothetical protein
MNAIAEIRRIEADLYRFLATASEAPRLIHDYLGDMLFRNYVPEEDHASEVADLTIDLESTKKSEKALEELVETIRDLLQHEARNDFRHLRDLIVKIVVNIQNNEHACLIDDDLIFDAIDAAEPRRAFACSVVISETTAAHCLNSDSIPHSPNPEPANANHENQTESNHPIAQPARRLPLFGKQCAA